MSAEVMTFPQDSGGHFYWACTFTFFLEPACAKDGGFQHHELSEIVLLAEVNEVLLDLMTIRIVAVPIRVRLEAVCI